MSKDLNKNSYTWWKADEKDMPSVIFSYLEYLDNQQGYRSADNLKNMRLYGNVESLTGRAYTFARSEPATATLYRVTMNVVQSMVDTVVSKITKNKPLPKFLTSGGDWSMQRKAQKLSKFIEGQFYKTDFFGLSATAFLHSCIFGTGAIKIYRQGKDIKAEHVLIDEIIVDDNESIYGTPRQMHQKKWVHKDVLKQVFPDKAGWIDLVGKQDLKQYYNYIPDYNGSNDMILVVESWHLRSGPDATDGKHVISIDNCILLEEDYTKDYFPFIFFRWGLRPIGFFGQGIAEQLQGLQLEINKILRTIQVSMHLVSIPKIFVEASSKIVTAHLNNKIGGIIKYSGQPPTPGQMGSIPPELFSHLDRLYTRCYEVIGVSQLAASSAKPSGLNSGKALRAYSEIESERFMSVGIRYQNAFLDAAKQFIELAKEIHEEEGNFEIKVAGSKFMETIKWSEVNLDEDSYVMQVFPTNALSSSPASRLQEVQELLQAGFISKEDGLKLLDFPDLEAMYSLENAPTIDIDWQIEKMIEKGEYQTPEPYQNLNLGIQKMQKAYLMYRMQNAPEDRLELLRRWMDDAQAMLDNAQEALAPPQVQLPPALPQRPPTSDLLPNQVGGLAVPGDGMRGLPVK